jgi:O-glycosyl hydrolase
MQIQDSYSFSFLCIKAYDIYMSSSVLLVVALSGSIALAQVPSGGTSVIPANSLLTTPVGGLANTNATAEVIGVTGMPFAQALRVTIRTTSPDTNATQLTILSNASIATNDVMLATFYVRGQATGNTPAQTQFLFEQSSSPWSKSVIQSASSKRNSTVWRLVSVPFKSIGNYTPGQVMSSLRFAFGPQTVEIGGLSVVNYRNTRTVNELQDFILANNPLGSIAVAVDFNSLKQTMIGLGGNFCQPRYGFTTPMDTVGNTVLKNLNVTHARIGIPLEKWMPTAGGAYQNNNQAKASFEALQILAKRKIPIVASVWEGPTWMMGGTPEQSGKVLPPTQYTNCIEGIAQYLKKAKDEYGVSVPYFSFNEPDYGVNFLFSSTQMRDFIRQAGARFTALGLTTKFIVGDTANGSTCYDYSLPILQDSTLTSYLGPIGFHCWDAMSASEDSYKKIALLGATYGKPIWCLEAGHDSGLWQQSNPWASWDNALRTAIAYEKTIRFTGASVMDYWTYQDNYPLTTSSGTPYPVFSVMRQMQDVFKPNAKIALTDSQDGDLQAIASRGRGGEFAVLLINSIGSGNVKLTGLPANATVIISVSDKNAQRVVVEKRFATDSKGNLTVKAPAQSIITIVSSGVQEGVQVGK